MLNVCSSGFYAWLKRGESRRQREDAKLLRRIQEIFARSGQSYGSPRVWAELCLTGWRVSRKRVARLMRLDHGPSQAGKDQARQPWPRPISFSKPKSRTRSGSDMQIATEEGWRIWQR